MTGFSWSRAFVRRRNGLVIAFAVLCSASSATPFAQGGTHTPQGPPIPQVSVINSAADPVPVTPLNVPYLIRLSVDASGASSGEECTALPVPEGKRLVLETVAVDLFKNVNLQGPPVAYVMTAFQFSSGFSIDRGLAIPVTERGGAFAGHLRTMVMTGPVTAGTEATVSLRLCAAAGSGVEGLLVGHLLPL
jgi:hypothetical protein